MGNSSRFDIFLDCLWGLALIVALHLLPFSSASTVGSEVTVGSSALWLHIALLVTFVYTYGLRLRRHLLGFQQTSNSRKHRD
ncbi:MAG: hypothetical protein RX318_04495 [bacterium]|nr:hypothetical protein [bacterium]